MGGSGSSGRLILHVDMDAFFASVEQRDHPEWRGKPLVVGAGPDERGVVAAASYEARVFGIHSAMPSREAGRRCPQAVFVEPRMARYAEVSREVFGIFERFTPMIEPLSVDEAFLDVTGARGIFGDGPEMARRIRGAIRSETGLTASVGVATNKFLAKLASDMNKPDGMTVVPADRAGILAFLAPLPVGRMWGVGKVTRAALESAGLRTMGDLQAASLSRLAAAVGATAAREFKDMAQGLDDRPVVTQWEEKSLSREYTFSVDCDDAEEVRRVLLELVEDVGRQLRELGRYAAVAQVKVRWKGFDTITRQRTLDEPLCDDVGLRAIALEIFQTIPLTRPVRLIGFGAERLVSGPSRQMKLFDGGTVDRVRRERLSSVVDRIRKDFGEGSIGRAGTGTRRPRAPQVRDEKG